MKERLLAFATGETDAIPIEILQKYLCSQISDTDPFFFIHIAALHERLPAIPQHLLTDAVLTFQASDGWTAVHYAANAQNLVQIPNPTENLFSVQTEDSRTPLHIIAENGIYDKNGLFTRYPPDCPIFESALLIRDEFGKTPLHTAIEAAMEEGVNLDYAMPLACYTPKTLLATDYKFSEEELRYEVDTSKGISPLELIIKNFPEFAENFLTIELPERAKKIVGEDWWARHIEIIVAKALTTESEATDMDLF